MSRKYRQAGYQDSGPKERLQPQRSERSPLHREGPRSPKMPGLGRVVKCAMCGLKLPPNFEEIAYTSQCPRCSADLHTCRNCVFFNPASRFECEQSIPRRVSPKDKRADCDFFEVRSTVEKITSSITSNAGISAGPQNSDDARTAFENLFKR